MTSALAKAMVVAVMVPCIRIELPTCNKVLTNVKKKIQYNNNKKKRVNQSGENEGWIMKNNIYLRV